MLIDLFLSLDLIHNYWLLFITLLPFSFLINYLMIYWLILEKSVLIRFIEEDIILIGMFLMCRHFILKYF